MKYKEIKEKSTEELQRVLVELSHKLREFNFKEANKQLGSVRDLRGIKRNIAQLKTLLKQRQS